MLEVMNMKLDKKKLKDIVDFMNKKELHKLEILFLIDMLTTALENEIKKLKGD